MKNIYFVDYIKAMDRLYESVSSQEDVKKMSKEELKQFMIKKESENLKVLDIKGKEVYCVLNC